VCIQTYLSQTLYCMEQSGKSNRKIKRTSDSIPKYKAANKDFERLVEKGVASKRKLCLQTSRLALGPQRSTGALRPPGFESPYDYSGWWRRDRDSTIIRFAHARRPRALRSDRNAPLERCALPGSNPRMIIQGGGTEALIG
jgi:hypothetical protein